MVKVSTAAENTPPHHMLIVGATGIIGRAAVEHFCGLEGWKVTCCSRREPDYPHTADFVSLDLLDATACDSALGEGGAVSGVTHCMFGAVFTKFQPSGARAYDDEHDNTNATMLTNFFRPFERGNRATLRHVSLMQGAKAYGAHKLGLDHMAMPYKEREPRVEHENWYWLQEDYLRSKQSAGSFTCARAPPTNPGLSSFALHALLLGLSAHLSA